MPQAGTHTSDEHWLLITSLYFILSDVYEVLDGVIFHITHISSILIHAISQVKVAHLGGFK